MSPSSIPKSLPGPFIFLDPTPDELYHTRSVQEGALPLARKIFLEDEAATPLVGFPILLSSRLIALEKALEDYLAVEEQVQVAIARKQGFNSKVYTDAWQSYSRLLSKATEYTVLSSYGRAYPNVFWLRHAAVVASYLQGTPRRLARLDSGLAREQGDRLKYVVFFHFLDRVLTLTYSLVGRLAEQVEEPESDLFPGLLTIMRDNVLLFTEGHISRDLVELAGYLKGHIGVDGRTFCQRLAKLRAWHSEEFRQREQLHSAVESLLGSEAADEPDRLLHRPGYIRYLAGQPGYDAELLMAANDIEIWEQLLPKLKEFELVRAFQRLVLSVTREGDRLAAPDPRTRGTGLPPRTLYLSVTTRPLDFMTPWVLDPEVGRFGLVYDISQFSQTLSAMKHTSQVDQERSFQAIFRFQRRINHLAFERRLRLEKYLGDGALYSGINRPHKLLAMALRVQRYYVDAVDNGFPFDRGLRIALNFGQYRMLPIQSSQPGETERYEFFGHGIVELSRLITGKAVKETDEIKTLLLGLGYPRSNVDQFFAPLERRNLDVVERSKEGQRFYAYINANGTLINEGIVATGDFVEQLGREGLIENLGQPPGKSGFVTISVRDGVDDLVAGIRRLGDAQFKGIGSLVVYEVVDGRRWSEEEIPACPETDLMRAVDAAYHYRNGATNRSSTSTRETNE
jgi:hypothetical protein